MRWYVWALLAVQIISAGYGIYDEFAPSRFPLHVLPKGMGLALALIGFTMAYTLAIVEKERHEAEAGRRARGTWHRVAERVSMCAAVHEREFYSLWKTQVAEAQRNIDVAHLGPRPPQNRHGEEEAAYFTAMATLYRNSRAQICRVERLTPEKREWITGLVRDFSGVTNFSLRVYRDPSKEEMPLALSISRVDDRCAWIVAVAEQESRNNVRDLLITGRDAVALLANYFQKRLWEEGIPIIDHGKVIDGWEQVLAGA